MSKILIRSPAVNERHIVTKDGRHMTFREQSAALDNGSDFPQPFKLNLDADQLPYKPGEYLVDPVSFYVDGKFGKLSIGRLRLLPAAPAKAA